MKDSITKKPFSRSVLIFEDIDYEIDRLTKKIHDVVIVDLKRKGAVIGISGGIDSSVTLALTVKALGNKRVLGIMLPERESSQESVRLGRVLADAYGVHAIVEDISAALEGFGCYDRRDESIRKVFSEFDPQTFKSKIGVHQSGLKNNLPPVFYLTIIDPIGNEKKKVIPLKEFLQIVASSNFKQRSRMALLYYHAEKNHFAMMGTANKHEIEQGFFVKYGDGGADLMPIGHLYKTQVYQLAEALGIPTEIIERTPTTDTYSAEQSQEEFFFQIPFQEMDLLWYGYENEYDPQEVADVMGMSKEEVDLIFTNFRRKQKTTDYLRMNPHHF